MPLVKIDPNFFNNDAQTNFAPETHANPGLDLTQTAMSATNILFEGIRGTGKTHILKMIRDENLKNFAKNRILPVYISLARLSEYESLDETKFRTYLYTNIVRLAFETINLNRKTIEEAGNTFLLKKLRSDAPILEFFTEMPFSEVLDSVKELFERLNKELLTSEIKVEKDKSKGFLGELGVKGVKATGSSSDKEKIEYILQRLSHNNASRYIIEFFKGLHDILDLNYSLLLLDEISGVSDKAQIEVFRLLKLIRASTETSEGTNFLYFNGSVYPPQSTNYASKSKGHEFDFILGEDCSMEYLEMDVLYEEYESFFKYITERRLQTLHPESKGSILWLFEDEKVQLLAAFASNGLPRRYFEIVKTAYGEASKKFSAVPEIKKIDMVSISSAIQTIVDGQTLNESQLTNKDFYYLEKVIIPRISARNTGAETRNESREDEKNCRYIYLSAPQELIDKN